MTNRLDRWLRQNWLLLVLAVLALGLFQVAAQPQMGGKGKGISIPGYDSQNRLSSLLYAKEATPKGNQLVDINGVKAELYSYENGVKTTNIVVNSPSCLYDQKAKVATSDQPVQASSGDGKIKLNGVGFRYDQTDSRIIVSNKVVIEINRDMVVKKQGK
ncbi:MAG TPA: hypothetical protein VGH19_12305 [Verrucomicrobiae bacterium]